MGPRISETLILCYEGKDLIVQINRRLSIRNTAHNGQHEKWSETALPGTNCSRKCERLQHFSNVVMKTAAVPCICWRSTVHIVISPVEKNCKTNAYPVGPVAQYLWEVLSVVSPTLHVLTKHPKTRNNKAEDGSIFGLLAKNTTPKFETQLTKAHNKYWAWTLKRCFLDEVCRSLIPVHNLL